MWTHEVWSTQIDSGWEREEIEDVLCIETTFVTLYQWIDTLVQFEGN